MSGATESQRAALRVACGAIPGGVAKIVRKHAGRETRVVVILGDLDDGNVYTGVYGLDRDGLIAALRHLLRAAESGDHTTSCVVNGETVAEYEGKPS